MTPAQQRQRRLDEQRRAWQNRSPQQTSMGSYDFTDDDTRTPYQPVNECPRITDNGIQDSSSDGSSGSCD